MQPTENDTTIYSNLSATIHGKAMIGMCGIGLTYRMCTAIKQARKNDPDIKGISIADVIYLNDLKLLAEHNDMGTKTLARISIVREKIQKLVNSRK